MIYSSLCYICLFSYSISQLVSSSVYSALGKFKEAIDMAKAVELLLAKPNASMNRMRSRSIHVLESFIHHWSRPLHQTLPRLLEGYTVGLTSGDTEDAAMNRKFKLPKCESLATIFRKSCLPNHISFSSSTREPPILFRSSLRGVRR